MGQQPCLGRHSASLEGKLCARPSCATRSTLAHFSEHWLATARCARALLRSMAETRAASTWPHTFVHYSQIFLQCTLVSTACMLQIVTRWPLGGRTTSPGSTQRCTDLASHKNKHIHRQVTAATTHFDQDACQHRRMKPPATRAQTTPPLCDTCPRHDKQTAQS